MKMMLWFQKIFLLFFITLTLQMTKVTSKSLCDDVYNIPYHELELHFNESSIEKYEECYIKQIEARALLEQIIDKPIYPELKRIDIKDIDLAENKDYKLLKRPFILTGLFTSNPSYLSVYNQLQQLDVLSSKHASSVSDYYPHNMLNQRNSKPYLYYFNHGLSDLLDPNTKANDCEKDCQYLHLQLDQVMWDDLFKSSHVNDLILTNDDVEQVIENFDNLDQLAFLDDWVDVQMFIG